MKEIFEFVWRELMFLVGIWLGWTFRFNDLNGSLISLFSLTFIILLIIMIYLLT
jgi:hypothetical protein